MIGLLARGADAETLEVVTRALERSFTPGQVRLLGEDPERFRGTIVVALAPAESDAPWLERLTRRPAKLLIFGPIGPQVASLAGVVLKPAQDRLIDAAQCAAAPLHGTAESAGAIHYPASGMAAASPLRRRAFCRFDFGREWNNLGYGRIGIGTGPWSLSVTARLAGATSVGDVVLDHGLQAGTAVALRELPHAAILWFARPVGPVDGPDWRIVESFISDHRAEYLPSRPHLRDIPHGAAAAVTTRIDCDEDIASGRPLLDLYRRRGHALSAAIMTGQPAEPAHISLLTDLKACGGSILSHSSSHAPDWGGSPQAAEREGRQSKEWLERLVPGLAVRYAVSPFHRNPNYVPAALRRAGYDGLVSGTIANDPQFLMVRGGAVPFGPTKFIAHSQSCMLHGDCLLGEGDPIRIYKEAFRLARTGGQFFGYLDHPFSARYAYGWASEAARLAVHDEFLSFMADECAQAGAPLLFVNEDACLDFMRGKAMTDIVFDEARGDFSVSQAEAAGLPLSVGFQGEVFPAVRHA